VLQISGGNTKNLSPMNKKVVEKQEKQGKKGNKEKGGDQ